MRNDNLIIRIILAIIIVYLFYLYYTVGLLEINNTLIEKVLFLDLIAFVLFVIKKESVVSLKNQYLTLSTVFLVGFVPTCFQYYFMYVNNMVPDLSLGYYLNTNVVNRSVIISSVGFVSYLFGYLHNSRYYIKQSFNDSSDTKEPRSIGIQKTSIVLFVVYFISMPAGYFQGGYGNADYGSRIQSVTLFAQNFYIYFVIASVAIESFKIWIQGIKLSFKDYLKRFNRIFILTLFLYCFLIVMSGDRDLVIYTLGALLLAFILSKGIEFSLKKTLMYGVPLVIGLFVFGLVRDIDFNASTSEKITFAISHAESMNMAFWFAATDEFARVVRAQHAIIMHVQENGHQFLTFVYEVLGLVPGLGFVFTSLFGISQDDLVSSRIATTYMGSDHGMGTTCIADLYLSSGIIGVFLFMFLLGFLYRKIESHIYTGRHQLGYWIFYITTMVYAVLIGRADMMTPFRHCFYVFFIVYIFNVKYFKKKSKETTAKKMIN